MSREDMRKRDARIIQLLGYGLKPAQIAERMGIESRTVSAAKYRSAIAARPNNKVGCKGKPERAL